jgi:hypothetical protein
MLEREDGIEVMKNIVQKFDKKFPSSGSQTINKNSSQGGTNIPLTTITSIPTYTSAYITTKMQKK